MGTRRSKIIFTLISSILLGSIFFIACSGSNTSITSDERGITTQANGRTTGESILDSPGSPETADMVSPDLTLISPGLSPMVQKTPLALTEESKPTLAVKADLEATDPSSVQLAAGYPQLVEFFAFW